MDSNDRQTLLGNYNDKIAVVNVPQVNISDLINEVKKNSQKLCRGRKNYANSSIPSSINDDVICILYDNYSTGNILNINLYSDKNTFLGKSLVVENADVHLTDSMAKGDDPLDLFLNNGNLYLEETVSPHLQGFSSQ
ncbi:MAG: hypothetical protein GXP45_07955 [bacterium]|nr:hypothetical protein [bacterium]